jgi:hypothetical protein
MVSDQNAAVQIISLSCMYQTLTSRQQANLQALLSALTVMHSNPAKLGLAVSMHDACINFWE